MTRSLFLVGLAVALFGGGGGQLTPAQRNHPGKTQHLTSADAIPDGLSSADWSSIGAAYQAHRHQAMRVGDGYRTSNPEQQWRTEFDGHGFITSPEGSAWRWGLELRGYGFAGLKRAIDTRAQVTAEGGRVSYLRDPNLREWFVNDERGLEHGFTIEERPAELKDGVAGLEFDLGVRGDLSPQVSAAGKSVNFQDPAGRTLVTYSGLTVTDATGRNLPSRFSVMDPSEIRLVVDERGARYPITIDPIAQQAYLKASNTGVNDNFGNSVAVSGDTVVVGALLEASNATGVNGDQTDNSASGAGAVYIFVRNGTTWSQQAYLKASNTNAEDEFGYSVAVSGDTVIVGAHYEKSSATGINGDQTDNSVLYAGAAYVFVRSGTTWSQQAYLKASNTNSDDQFGASVAISGDTVVVGASGESSSATGINGNQTDNGASGSGAAYVFVRNGTTWSQQAYVKASNTGAGDQFGYSVTVSGDSVIVGAPREDSSATGINGDQSNDGATDSGAAYVFVRNGTTWSQQAYLKASNTNPTDLFGYSVAISNGTAVVGAPLESSSATGINGDQTDNSALYSGAAYVFVRNGTTWSQQAYVKASNTGANDNFGNSVAASGDTVVVAARGEASKAAGIDGNQTDNSAGGAGAAYVFMRDGVTWTQQAYLKASNTDAGDDFGYSVAVSGDTVVVGASEEASNATGVNGNRGNNSVEEAGAAYVFSGPSGPTVPLFNISTRVGVKTGDNVLIGGVIVEGVDAKSVLFRALGPTLGQPPFNVAGALADPTLELHGKDNAGQDIILATNDNWQDTQAAAISATGLQPPDSAESAILASLPPGSYTVIVRGKNNTTGVGLLEAYDTSPASNSQFANISSRGFVDTADNVMIGGFVVGQTSTFLVRGIGPTLGAPPFNVANALADPVLELHGANGDLIASNDDWQTDAEASLIPAGLQPPNSKDSALHRTLTPGNYTGIVRGSNNTVGVALVEVYHLP